MFEASCRCGAVRIEVDAAPERVACLDCSIPEGRGELWAYCAPGRVRVHAPEGATTIYPCRDVWSDRRIELHACKVCDCTTHWAPADGALDRIGVNARLMAPEAVASASAHASEGATPMPPLPVVALGLVLLVSSVQTSCGGLQSPDQCSVYGYGPYGDYDANCP